MAEPLDTIHASQERGHQHANDDRARHRQVGGGGEGDEDSESISFGLLRLKTNVWDSDQQWILGTLVWIFFKTSLIFNFSNLFK